MAFNKKVLASGLATLAILATTVAASAAPAFATANVNVRSGPGTGFRVVDTLRRGEGVDVEQCRGSWCFVDKRGTDGWVSSSYLSGGRPGWDNDRDRDDRWDRDGRWDRDDRWDRHPPRWGHPRPPRWDHNPRPRPVYPDNRGSVCFNSPNSYFCIGN